MALVRAQPLLNGEQVGGCAAGGADLGLDVLHVVAGRLRQDDHPRRDLLARTAPGQ